MEYRLRSDFGEKKGVISNTHGFLSTYLDGGFKDKWSGYWSPSWKYLDYFAVKINGVWLNSENLVEAKYGDKITYRHHLDSLEVLQEISTPEDLPGFKVEIRIENRSESQKAVRTSIEPGIDIRPKTQDIGSAEYAVEASNAGMKISKNDRYLSISSKEFSFEEEDYIKEHFPREKQVCLIPGEIYYMTELEPEETKKSEIAFKTDGKIEEKTRGYTGGLRDSELSRSFNYSLESLENLFYGKRGSGVIAGHPWFQNYWARDSFWTALGMIDAGMFEKVEKILLNFTEGENLPSKICPEKGVEEDYPRADSIPLFAIAVDKLDRYYGAEELVQRAEELLSENRPNGKIMKHDEDGTWMDTLERAEAVDIQSLWIEALERFDRGTKHLREGLEEFKQEDYMRDNLSHDFESINPAVPLMFGQLDEKEAEKYLEKVNGEFSSRFGARTRSVTDPGYDPSGYHTGSVWGLTTCWAAAANLCYGNTSHGKNFLKKLAQFLDRNQLGALPEVVDAESGESLGCDEQAWSAGLFVHVIDSYLLGIEVRDDSVIVDPAEVTMTRRSKKVRGEEIDLKVNNGEAEVLNDPGLEIEVR
jgi:glycogen debranching enzyme